MKQQNRDLAAASKDVEAAASEQQASYGKLFPKVELKSSYTHLNDDIVIDIPAQRIEREILNVKIGIDVDPPPVKVRDKRIYNSHILASQPLYAGGRIAAGIDASSAEKDVAEASRAMVQDEKIVEAMTRYFQVVMARRAIAVLNSIGAELERMEKMANTLVQTGMAAKFSTLQVAVARADLAARLQDAEGKAKLADLAFKSSTGLEMTHTVNYSSELKFIPLTVGLDVFKTQSLTRRREFTVLEHKAKQVDALKSAKTGEMLPTVYAFGKRELLADQLTALEPLWAVGVGIDIPITAGISQFPERHRAAHLAEKIEILKQKARHEIPLQVESYHASAVSLGAQLKSFDVGIGQAREALRLAQIRFNSGTGSSLEVLKAQADFEGMQVKQLLTLEEYNRKLLELYQASGAAEEYISAYSAQGK